MNDRDPIAEALVDPRTYANRETYHALLTQLRREDPLYWAAPKGYRPFWVVTKHADILEVERQPAQFLSGPRLEIFSAEQERKVREATGRDAAVGKTVLHMDGAEHRAYRGLSQGWFMPNNLNAMEQPLAALALRYVDRLEAAGGEADFVTLVSELFPLEVILMILGLPSEEAPRLLRLTRDFVGRDTAPVPPGLTREDLIIRASQAIFDYFGAVVAARQKQPRADVASLIANATVNGETIGRAEALSYLLLLGLAGHDTTNGTLAGGLLAFIRNPDQLARLKADRGLMPTAIDEILRWVTPVNNFMRTAVADYTLRGKTVKAGDALLLAFASGNRDESVFADPFAFRVDRKPNPQVSFGYGAHVCLGQHLAKMELNAFFRELIPRLDGVELAGDAQMLQAVTANQLVTLPIRYRMSKRARVLEPAGASG
jgi:cytochrome P450